MSKKLCSTNKKTHESCHESWVGQSTKTVNVKVLVTPELTNSQSSWR